MAQVVQGLQVLQADILDLSTLRSPVMSVPPSQRTFEAGSSQPIPADLTGVRWPDGTTECRFRLTHPSGSLVATDGDIGIVLTEPSAACTLCSDACVS